MRMVRRTAHQRTRWFAQRVLKGTPWQKPKNPVAQRRTVGLDIGPSTIAALGEGATFLARFCDEAAPLGQEVRRIQRALDRSPSATNVSELR